MKVGDSVACSDGLAEARGAGNGRDTGVDVGVKAGRIEGTMVNGVSGVTGLADGDRTGGFCGLPVGISAGGPLRFPATTTPAATAAATTAATTATIAAVEALLDDAPAAAPPVAAMPPAGAAPPPAAATTAAETSEVGISCTNADTAEGSTIGGGRDVAADSNPEGSAIGGGTGVAADSDPGSTLTTGPAPEESLKTRNRSKSRRRKVKSELATKQKSQWNHRSRATVHQQTRTHAHTYGVESSACSGNTRLSVPPDAATARGSVTLGVINRGASITPTPNGVAVVPT
jgi:hypothetical protein